MRFRPLSSPELDALDDERLIAYIRAAHGAGQPAYSQQALGVLVYSRWHNVERRVAMKVPPADVEDVTGEIVTAAFESAFDGTSVGEFVKWLNTITQRRIADYHRRGRGKFKTVPIGPADDDRPTAVDPADPGYGDYVELVDVIDGILAGLSPDHRTVVELVVFQARSAREAADAVPGMTEANAYQVVSRFRRDLRAALADDDGHTL